MTQPELIIQMLYIIVVIIVSMTGNILIITVIITNHRLRTVDNLLVVNLAVSDCLLTLIECGSNTLRQLNPDWNPPHPSVCYIILASSVFCGTASVFTQSVVAVNRYLSINYPLTYDLMMSRRRLTYAVIIIWFGAILLSCPPLIWRPLAVVCGVESYNDSVTLEIVYMAAEWLFLFVVPFLLMFAVYLRIYKIALWHSKRVIPMASQNDTKQNRVPNLKKEVKAAKMLITISGLFFVCWFPFFVVLTCHKFSSNSISPKVFKVFLYMIYTAPAVNPFVYAFWNKRIRIGVTKLLKIC